MNDVFITDHILKYLSEWDMLRISQTCRFWYTKIKEYENKTQNETNNRIIDQIDISEAVKGNHIILLKCYAAYRLSYIRARYPFWHFIYYIYIYNKASLLLPLYYWSNFHEEFIAEVCSRICFQSSDYLLKQLLQDYRLKYGKWHKELPLLRKICTDNFGSYLFKENYNILIHKLSCMENDLNWFYSQNMAPVMGKYKQENDEIETKLWDLIKN